MLGRTNGPAVAWLPCCRMTPRVSTDEKKRLEQSGQGADQSPVWNFFGSLCVVLQQSKMAALTMPWKAEWMDAMESWFRPAVVEKSRRLVGSRRAEPFLQQRTREMGMAAAGWSTAALLVFLIDLRAQGKGSIDPISKGCWLRHFYSQIKYTCSITLQAPVGAFLFLRLRFRKNDCPLPPFCEAGTAEYRYPSSTCHMRYTSCRPDNTTIL